VSRGQRGGSLTAVNLSFEDRKLTTKYSLNLNKPDTGQHHVFMPRRLCDLSNSVLSSINCPIIINALYRQSESLWLELRYMTRVLARVRAFFRPNTEVVVSNFHSKHGRLCAFIPLRSLVCR
jgi:hypothetical protein